MVLRHLVVLEHGLVAGVPGVVEEVRVDGLLGELERRDQLPVQEDPLAHRPAQLGDVSEVAAAVALPSQPHEPRAHQRAGREVGDGRADRLLALGRPCEARERELVVLAQLRCVLDSEHAPVVGGGREDRARVLLKHVGNCRVDGGEHHLVVGPGARRVGLDVVRVPLRHLHRPEEVREDRQEVVDGRRVGLVGDCVGGAVTVVHDALADFLGEARPQHVEHGEVRGLRVEERRGDACHVARRRVVVEKALLLKVVSDKAEGVRVLLRHQLAVGREQRRVHHAPRGLGVVAAHILDALELGLGGGRLAQRCQLGLRELLLGHHRERQLLQRRGECRLVLGVAVVHDAREARLAVRLVTLRERGGEVACVDVRHALLVVQVLGAVGRRQVGVLERLGLIDHLVLPRPPVRQEQRHLSLDLVDEALDLLLAIHQVCLLRGPDRCVLDQHPQREGGCKQKVAREGRKLRVEEALDLVAPHAREDDVPAQVEPAAAGAASHLAEVHGVEEDGISCEDRRLRRHVDTHRERLGGDDDSETLHAEEALDRHAVLLRETGVVAPDAAEERLVKRVLGVEELAAAR
mmetsp:Transcript_8533/g.21195  ORF Transcript_8533/g.21195 Transcript_8533/m.21195 type:complete len:578 (-) Transcript_8533:1503-3236(-)